MPLFVCDECNSVDNTATGFYWAKGLVKFAEDRKNGKALCAACTPTHFEDGTPTHLGEWHGLFERKEWDGKREVINR